MLADIADGENARVLRCRDGAAPEVVAGGNGEGNALNQLRAPRGVAVLCDGSVVAADTGNHRVLRCRDGAAPEVVAGFNGVGNALNQLRAPRGVAVLRDDSFFVADTGNDRVLRCRDGATPESWRAATVLATRSTSCAARKASR